MNTIKPLLLCLLLAFLAIPANAELEGWQYYKNIEIKENSGTTLTDYQVLLDLSGTNFPVNAKHDGSDLRFVLDGKELSYWIEEFNPDAKTGKVWLKVPKIPASGTVTLQIYYGNPSASAMSNGDKVFEFFDDFEDYNLGDLAGHGDWSWTESQIGSEGNPEYANIVDTYYFSGRKGLELHAHHGSGKGTVTVTANSPPFSSSTNALIVSYWIGRASTERQANIDAGRLRNIYTADGTSEILTIAAGNPGDGNTLSLVDYSTSATGADGRTWYKIDRLWPSTVSGTIYTIGLEAEEYDINWGVISVNYDLVVVRKYTSPEPTVTFSSEQHVSAITLTKSISSTDLQEATPITAIITIKNTGSKPVTNIKLTDSLPSAFKLVSGSLSKTISILSAGESATLEYTFEPYGIGSFILPKAVVTYGDKTASSKSITVNIIAKDSDNDGLSDKQELQLGTDPNSADSDNDGLPDKLEMDQGLNPRLADSDGDGINDKQDIYPLDKDNDGIPDSEDPLPTIPQNYVYAGIGLIILAGLVAVGAFIKSQKNKKWKDTFYSDLNLSITPDKESYELDDTIAFTVSVSNNFGDIASGSVESPYFNPMSLTRIKSGKVYREKVHIKAKEVGIFNGNATATITDVKGNVHKLKESFSVEVTPYIPKLNIKVIGVEKYEQSTN